MSSRIHTSLDHPTAIGSAHRHDSGHHHTGLRSWWHDKRRRYSRTEPAASEPSSAYDPLTTPRIPTRDNSIPGQPLGYQQPARHHSSALGTDTITPSNYSSNGSTKMTDSGKEDDAIPTTSGGLLHPSDEPSGDVTLPTRRRSLFSFRRHHPRTRRVVSTPGDTTNSGHGSDRAAAEVPPEHQTQHHHQSLSPSQQPARSPSTSIPAYQGRNTNRRPHANQLFNNGNNNPAAGSNGRDDPFADSEQLLADRGERLADTQAHTAKMRKASANFYDSIKAYNDRNANKKWYQI
ncbi:hypothetical protein H4R33_006963 [Dimargaris cristalligena]|uniref:V-SNARE coiled-coil homology domain-containing protein n=1 Tax=Dimargaris cristalligena TaxID=215637 RepID=A0A4P9ZLA0_9FUNG|nr:hypothetical protein H4R33_006963 [Dimargaris cristalligena]RKP34047.1 hypothetical protein BJ085DRAFT_32953 [Dimargaris cristalligena]|eukprot:RKP34047.1 hypothetical protein BJ085DRAFT_32953 [Dimargaris cristalligena]